ncbi:alginate export family protein [Aliiglaciecola sp. 2_MG-2023]|uniref:alginate export family protein n=1 Tax=unclassified Aliiglaciecola TaxID=2593648 RepID=UPI0026E26D4E|nr:MULTISPECIES: alginate export family protein [unclassified Aliiglaciecola]MDO6712450.1 alginate export family protein [Aliiglaciecola sp. 2_MG-2023]MDO6753492.1 alginate export family protein [Aliiglaciecola sp. 1_MG-2023]
MSGIREKMMKTMTKKTLNVAVAVALLSVSSASVNAEESIAKAMTSGTAGVNFNLRYESVDQDNAVEDASALTLRTLLSYKSASYKNFSAMIEVEDTRIVLGQGDYTVGPTGYNSGMYSVIADPEHTELDQGYIQYSKDNFTAKLGRQVITMDNHRFIGHVGWRQDRQTFDGISVNYCPAKAVSLKYAYLTQRNRIFAEAADFDAKDHLLNASYNSSLGKITAYGYLLEIDNNVENSLDTFGIRFSGDSSVADTKIIYTAEYATQSSDSATTSFDADYLMLEVGGVFSGVTAKVGYEVLGSDDGNYGFSTPLATLHKFNGWADVFLGTPAEGLVDLSVTLSGQVAGGSLTATYHDFEADDASESVDDLGSEIDLQYAYKISANYSMGIKYAAYSGESGRVDTDKLWLWLGAKF